ncbi:hypothetical protein U9M48_032558, partial [Paspalum notatum var. saurae]
GRPGGGGGRWAAERPAVRAPLVGRQGTAVGKGWRRERAERRGAGRWRPQAVLEVGREEQGEREEEEGRRRKKRGCWEVLAARAHRIRASEPAPPESEFRQGDEHELVKARDSNSVVFDGLWIHANFLAKRKGATTCPDLVLKYFFAELKCDYKGLSCLSCKLDPGV